MTGEHWSGGGTEIELFAHCLEIKTLGLGRQGEEKESKKNKKRRGKRKYRGCSAPKTSPNSFSRVQDQVGSSESLKPLRCSH